MPIRIRSAMPVIKRLKREGIFVMTEKRASTQDIRELRIAILNIMPEKENTELQLLRLLSNSPLQTKVTFLRLDSHHYKHVSEDYLTSYYRSFSEARDRYFDGLIITGAPVENLPFEQVDYWAELSSLMDWADEHVTTTMYICWASQAGLYHHYGIEKFRLPEKLSGIYAHQLLTREDDLVKGFDDMFFAPHSRYTGIRSEDILCCPALRILAESKEAGPYLITDVSHKHVFVGGHPEYSYGTLAKEYRRDIGRGLNPKIPVNYFPGDDPEQPPVIRWSAHSNLLFSNWLNYYVYQITPYQLPSMTE